MRPTALWPSAVGSPEERDRLRDVTRIMLDHSDDILTTPVADLPAESPAAEEQGNCVELIVLEA